MSDSHSQPSSTGAPLPPTLPATEHTSATPQSSRKRISIISLLALILGSCAFLGVVALMAGQATAGGEMAGLRADKALLQMRVQALETGTKELSENNWTSMTKRYMMPVWIQKV